MQQKGRVIVQLEIRFFLAYYFNYTYQLKVIIRMKEAYDGAR